MDWPTDHIILKVYLQLNNAGNTKAIHKKIGNSNACKECQTGSATHTHGHRRASLLQCLD